MRLNFGIYIYILDEKEPLQDKTTSYTHPEGYTPYPCNTPPHHMDQVSHGFAAGRGPKELFALKRIRTINLAMITTKLQGLPPIG
jgi:hypothetical protein